jgi:hypothetical protein
MERNFEPRPATLNTFGFAIGSALAGFILRLLLIPSGLVGRSSTLMLAEGDIGGYLVRALIFALFAGIAGMIIAIVHNEFAKRPS